MASAEIVEEVIDDSSEDEDENPRSISGLFAPDISWSIWFGMSAERRNKILHKAKGIIGLLYRRYIDSVPKVNRQLINPINGASQTNQTDNYSMYRLCIELTIIESYKNPQDIYFEFEIHSYDNMIDESDWYLDLRQNIDAHVYLKDLTEILMGLRHHIFYDNDTEDEDEDEPQGDPQGEPEINA